MTAVRSSTPDADIVGGHTEGVVGDWVTSCVLPVCPLSAPSSATKGHVLRSRGMRDLSPTTLGMRLGALEREELPSFASATPTRTRRMWGHCMVFDCSWTFWTGSWGRDGPEQRLEEMGQCCTTKEFWALFDSLPLSAVPAQSALHLFRTGIRPTWEDEHNANGGHFRFVVKDDAHPSRLWLKLALAVVGRQLGAAEHVCGIAVTNRDFGTMLSLWIDSTDPILRDALADELQDMLGAGVQTAAFKGHRQMLQLPPPVSPSPSISVATARAPLIPVRRRTRSAPCSPCFGPFGRGLLEEADAAPFAAPQSTAATAGRALRFPSDASLPPIAPQAAAAPDSDVDTPGLARQQSKRALKAGVRCLDPDHIGAHTASAGLPSAGPSTRRSASRRSHSDSERHLYVAAQPLLWRRSQRRFTSPSPMRNRRISAASPPVVRFSLSPNGAASSRRGLSPSVGLSPAKTPQMWADAPWNPELHSRSPSAGGTTPAAPSQPLPSSAQQQQDWGGHHGTWARRDEVRPAVAGRGRGRGSTSPHGAAAKVQMRPVPEPAGRAAPTKDSKEDPHSEWQLHQRARDQRQRQSPPLLPDRRGPSGKGGRPAPAANTGAVQGRSQSLGFVHKGYLYPAGLNRKQRRTIIFNSDRAKRGEVPDGQWVGVAVPDGPVTDEEMQLLRAGKPIQRTVPLADSESLPRSRESPMPAHAPEEDDIMQLRSPATPTTPPGVPVDVDTGRRVSPPPEDLPGQEFLPSGSPPPCPDDGRGDGDMPLRLNPDAAAFVPCGGGGPLEEPPVLINGVPYQPKTHRMPPVPDRVVVVRSTGGAPPVMLNDGTAGPGPYVQRVPQAYVAERVVFQRPAQHVVHTVPGPGPFGGNVVHVHREREPTFGGPNVVHVQRVVSGPSGGLPGGLGRPTRVVTTTVPPGPYAVPERRIVQYPVYMGE
eukprot:TRINITY_DN7167_c0_g1_i1.p1 TRINITY_DN7167_c0_g1~~TRINITY_DN7167_c0_g1_i1.p1  ORF type:complete len:933 (+),score=117.30 TRINITY_DN7167_c0_g1_i1:94-2892(+)